MTLPGSHFHFQHSVLDQQPASHDFEDVIQSFQLIVVTTCDQIYYLL